MKKNQNKVNKYQVFSIYLLILLSLYGFHIFFKNILSSIFIQHVFICPIENPVDFDCAGYYIQGWLTGWIISIIVTIIIGYFVFKKYKRHITQKIIK